MNARVTTSDCHEAHAEAVERDRWFRKQNRSMAEVHKHYWRRTLLDAREIRIIRNWRLMWDGQVGERP